MQKSTVALLLISVAVLTAALTVFLYTSIVIAEVRIVPIDLQVDKLVGFNLDTDALHLGRVMPGGYAERDITLSHGKRSTLYARITVLGDVAKFVEAFPSALPVQRGVTREVTFKAIVPPSTAPGNYTGYARIVFRRFP